MLPQCCRKTVAEDDLATVAFTGTGLSEDIDVMLASQCGVIWYSMMSRLKLTFELCRGRTGESQSTDAKPVSMRQELAFFAPSTTIGSRRSGRRRVLPLLAATSLIKPRRFVPVHVALEVLWGKRCR